MAYCKNTKFLTVDSNITISSFCKTLRWAKNVSNNFKMSPNVIYNVDRNTTSQRGIGDTWQRMG